MVRRPIRFLLMALAIIALLAGLWGGLLRLGWHFPVPRIALIVDHGPLMVCGFLGTLVALERAAALGLRWTYVGPLLTGLGGLILIASLRNSAGPFCMFAGSASLVAVFAIIIWQQPTLFAATMGIGAVCWFLGSFFWWMGQPIFAVVSWWMGFLVLTIAGERLELSRMRRLSRRAEKGFVLILAILLVGLTLGGIAADRGARLTGLALLALTVWLALHDVARRTVRQPGLPRFIAACLLTGYVWLGVAGILMLRFGTVVAGPRYDAVLHAVFLGFVFSMIFGHAPIIFPAVLGLPVPFRRIFYAHWAALHLSLLLRLVGDLALGSVVRQWGGMLNVAAIVLFLLNTGFAVMAERWKRRAESHSPSPQKGSVIGSHGLSNLAVSSDAFRSGPCIGEIK